MFGRKEVRRKAAAALIGIAIAVCLLTGCVLINYGNVNGGEVAEAIKTGASTVSAGDIVLADYDKPRPDKNVFDGEKLEKLYGYLIGNTNGATYDQLVDKLDNEGNFTSSKLRTQNGNNLITVTIGGI